MKYKVKIESTNADVDTSQAESVTFMDAVNDRVVMAEYYTNRFMNGKAKIVLYDEQGKRWPRESKKTMGWNRVAWDICVAHCANRGYDERQM